MPGSPQDPLVKKLRSAYAGTVKARGADSPEARDTRRALAAAGLAVRIDELVAGWPELSGERLDRIAALLRAGGRKT